MSTQLSAPTNRQTAEALARSKGEPDWLVEMRGNAAEQVATLSWPKPEKMNIERWELSAVGSYQPAEAISSVEQMPAQVKNMISEKNVIVQRNSSVVYKAIDAELSNKGVIFTDLETAVKEHSDLVKPYLFNAVKADENKFTALQAATWNGGVFLYVPRNVEVDIPLQVVQYNDDAKAAFAPHIVVVAEANSRVTYVDTVLSEASANSEAFVHPSIVEVYAKPGSQVRYASVRSMAASGVDLSHRRAIVEDDARVEWMIGDLNDGNTLSETRTVMQGRGSTSDTKIISIGKNNQKMSLTANAVHFGKHSDSDMIIRAVMKDSSQAIINGITKIEHGATKANGEQTERVLMLSPKARGDANPILLIDEDDVTAGHAASAGQVNPEQVYYLMSRGISRTTAERLIINGFLAPQVAEIAVDAVREQLLRLIERKLEG